MKQCFFETGAKRDIRGGLVKDLETKRSGTFNTIAILGSAAAGSILGGLAGSGKGSLIGGSIGASAGTGIVMLRKGKNVGIKEDQEFEIELTSGVVLPVTDY